MLTNRGYNPDVLTCLANLSSDEVFTPPKLANEILDLLPASLWSDPDATFLDPGCKSGVFLREIAKRLDVGLEPQIPDNSRSPACRFQARHPVSRVPTCGGKLSSPRRGGTPILNSSMAAPANPR